MVNLNLSSTPKPVGISMIVHRAVVKDQIFTGNGVKSAVKVSIMRNNETHDHFHAPVVKNGGNAPTWNCVSDMVVDSTEDTLKTDYVSFEVTHNGTFHRLIGEAQVSLTALTAGNGIGKEMGYPLFRRGNYVGYIVISHEIRVVEDMIDFHYQEEEEPRTGGYPLGGGHAVEEDGNGGPPCRRRRRVKMSDAFMAVVNCFTVAGITVAADKLQACIFGGDGEED